MAKYKVLSTKKLDPSLVVKAGQNDIEIIEQDFISITPVSSINKLHELISLAIADITTVVFTSQNAVFAVDKMLHQERATYRFTWEIFCLSGKTREAILKCATGQIAAVADNSASLAERIIERGIKEVIFFCGNKRRDELPFQLEQAGIVVHEYVVYENIDTPVVSNIKLDGILFFSPSAVSSFFSVNQIKQETVCFAIGQTTAGSIAEYTSNKIIVSEAPDQQSMLAAVNLYFQNINCYE